ncbi:MAG: hypothetical protein KDB10_20455, partial [Acidimicrobiales bacterium]|nr:hypothetical protein [Acidimicrobiales bacterium]
MTAGSALVERYLLLGLRLGRHLDGLVDAYYGPPALARRVEAEPRVALGELVAEASRLVADLDGPGDLDGLDAGRRRWLRAQCAGLVTTAAKLRGDAIGYSDEVESCYGVRPRRV